MSLDIHLGKNKQEAMYSDRKLLFGEALHDVVFENIDVIKKYVQFCRAEDYYKDTIYQGEQIVELQSELHDIAKETTYKPLKSFAEALEKVCSKACSMKLNIYFFSD